MKNASNTMNPVARRRRGTREETRERLLQAAIELIRQGGIGAVSTVSVTQAAGFTQSGFYRHFRNVDECLRAAAEHIAAQVRAFIAEDRRRAHATGESEHFRAVLNLFIEERHFAELWVRHRHDLSPLGEVMRELMAQIRADWVADAWALAQWGGIGAEHQERVALQAEFILASVLATGEALLDGRLRDADLGAAELTALTDAIAKDLVSRTKSVTTRRGGRASGPNETAES